jgi:minor extracellular serine protease Vpr
MKMPRFAAAAALLLLVRAGPPSFAAAGSTRFIVELTQAPAGVAKARAAAAGQPFDLATYEASLRATQDAFLRDLAARGIAATLSTGPASPASGSASTIPLRWTYVYNGLAIEAPDGADAVIATMPGVRHVQGDTPVQAFLSFSVPYTNAPQAWQTYGARGEGQSVAVIDTGIDWAHPMFTNNPALPPGPLHPKVKFYLSLTAGAVTDDFGHGSHCSGISAGDSSLGYTTGTVSEIDDKGRALFDGMAPKADLWGYKVLTTSGSGVTTSIVTAIDDAASRGAKVINLSLGSNNDDPESANSSAVDNAMKAGTVVAVAAGNAGPGYHTIGTPATARLALTVGASTSPRDNQYFAVDTTASPPARLKMGLFSNSPAPGQPALQSTYVYVGEGCTPADYLGRATINGRIALIKRGTCTFTSKAILAQEQGAAAALIFNNVAGDYSGSMEKTRIVVGALSDVNGAYLVGFTGTDGLSTHVVMLDPVPVTMVGQIAGFSSRGPTADFRIKPDVVAPGNAVMSATSKIGIPTQSMVDPSGYTIAGGTSMATPHVAGASAVLRQIYPAWNPFDVRLALMNTARLLTDPADGKLYSVQDQGAGLIDVAAAASTKGFLYVARPDLAALATEGSYSFGEVENQRGIVTRSATFRIRDVSGTTRRYALSWSPGDGKGRGGVGKALPASGFKAALSPSSVRVPAGGEASFTLTVTVDGSMLAEGDYEGRVVATAADQLLRAPVFYRAAHRSFAPHPAPVLDTPADSTDGTIRLAWTSVPDALRYRLQEATDPGSGIFSDDAESGTGRWSVSGTADTVSWTSSQLRAHGGTASFFALQGPDQDNQLRLTTPVTVPAGTSASLSFWTFVDTEPDFDFGHVEASADGTSWTELANVTGYSGGWVRQEVDLSSYAGGPVYVRFRYVSDLIFDAGLYEGWYVDDIAISKANWSTIAEPARNRYTVSGKAPGTYYYRVAAMFNSPDIRRAQGPFSNVVGAIVHAQ